MLRASLLVSLRPFARAPYCLRFYPCLWAGLLCLATTAALGQAESDERPMIEVDEGFGVQQDSIFLLNIRFRMQNRAGMRTMSLEDWSVRDFEARVRRLRLRFDGFVGTPRLQYYIQLSFSEADQDFENSGEPRIIRDAIVYYSFSPRLYVGFGQAKLPGNRQRVTSSGNMQFADRSIANASFTLDRDFGGFAYYSTQLGPSVFHAKAAITTGEGRDATRTDRGLAYTLRAEWLPWGAFAGNGDYSEGDLEFEPRPKLSLAATYNRNENTVQSGGQIGQPLGQGVDLDTWIADASFKYRGHAGLLEAMYRESSAFEARGEDGLPTGISVGMGLNIQYSYTTRQFWELALRYSTVQIHDRSSLPDQQELLLGVNRYLNGHRIKLQGHVGYQSMAARRWLLALFQVEFGI
jgi:phosphate-selective porin OprO and OprP